MEFKYPALPYLHGARYIRLVSLLPGNGRLQLRFHSKSICLDHEALPPFEALSYVWGTRNKPSQAEIVEHGSPESTCCGQKMQIITITQNLATALQHLRDPNKPRTLWIDAICIDQTNSTEKIHQVTFMGEIFQKAERVVIWLGPASDDSDRALSIVEQIGSQVIVDWAEFSMSPAPDAQDSSLGNELEPFPAYFTNLDAKALEALYDRAWFERVRVRQEAAFAKSAVFHAGHTTVDGKFMQNTARCLYHKSIHKRAFANNERDSTTMGEGSTTDSNPFLRLIGSNRSWLVTAMCQPAIRFFPIWLHYYFEGMHCGDPRDRVYGFLSLLRGLDHETLELVLDYQAPVVDCYKNLTLHHIRSDRSLSVLACCSLSYKTIATYQCPPKPVDRSTNLPSWTPDWSVDLDRNPVYSPILGARPFLASAEYFRDRVLRVEGLQCGTVDTVSQIDRSSTLALLRSLRKYCLEHSCATASIENQSPKWYRPTGQSLAMTLSRILTRDRFYETCHPLPLNLIPTQTMLSAIDRLLSTHNENFSWSDLCLSEPKDRTDGTNTEFSYVLKSFLSNLIGRELFTTSEGHLGMGPASLQPGDRICLLLGCEFVIALRPQSSNAEPMDALCSITEQSNKPVGFSLPNVEQFLALGDCFVPGLMAGEPLLGPLPSHMCLIMRKVDGEDDYQTCFLDKNTCEQTQHDPRIRRLEHRLSELLQIQSDEQGFEITPSDKFRGEHGELRYELSSKYFLMLGIDIRYFDLV